MLANLNHILSRCRKEKYAVGAFNFCNLEIAQAIVLAAHELKSPVILQTSEGAIDYAGMEFLGVIAQTAAAMTSIPIAIHLDHGKNIDIVIDAIESGYYTSVMFDGSQLSFSENVRHTKEIVKIAHKKRITVEAELGRIYGVEDNVSVNTKEATYTDPKEAEEFVKKTGCDALAIAIGTAHGAHKSNTKPSLDFNRLKEVASLVSIPLVLHGASTVPTNLIQKLHKQCAKFGDCERIADAQGIPVSQEKKAIKLGISKINIDTDLRIAFTAAIRDTLMYDHTVYDPRKILGPARDLIISVVKEKIKILGSKNKS